MKEKFRWKKDFLSVALNSKTIYWQASFLCKLSSIYLLSWKFV